MTVALEVVPQSVPSTPHSPHVFICTSLQPCTSARAPVIPVWVGEKSGTCHQEPDADLGSPSLLGRRRPVSWPRAETPALLGKHAAAGKAPVQGQAISPLYCRSKQEGVCLCRVQSTRKGRGNAGARGVNPEGGKSTRT